MLKNVSATLCLSSSLILSPATFANSDVSIEKAIQSGAEIRVAATNEIPAEQAIRRIYIYHQGKVVKVDNNEIGGLENRDRFRTICHVDYRTNIWPQEKSERTNIFGEKEYFFDIQPRDILIESGSVMQPKVSSFYSRLHKQVQLRSLSGEGEPTYLISSRIAIKSAVGRDGKGIKKPMVDFYCYKRTLDPNAKLTVGDFEDAFGGGYLVE